jgi:hypothetical protein
MLNLLKKLLAGKPASQVAAVPAEFPAYVDKAIQLITASSGQLEDGELLGLFVAAGIPETEATELVVFLPIAFCRHALTNVKWPDYYVECISEHQQQKVSYDSNLRYGAIQHALRAYLAGDYQQGDYYKIAGRCASFHALNTLLLKHPGAKLADLKVTPEHILR